MDTRQAILLSILVALTGNPVQGRPHDRIVFFGDSITEEGDRKGGYVTLVRDSLALAGDSSEVIGAGISGHKVPDLLARLDRDVIARKPTIVVIYIGINDVWHSILPGLHGTPPDEFRTGMNTLVKSISGTGARVILCTPSMVGEKTDGSNPLDSLLDVYAGITRDVATDTGTRLCDLRKEFLTYLRDHNPHNVREGILTRDGVHLTPAGNRFVAEAMLDALHALRH